MVQTIYQKKNGEIVDRITTFTSNYKIGEVNGNGWKVLDIKHKYKGKYYPVDQYYQLLTKSLEREKKKIILLNNIKYIYENINRILGFIILIKILEALIKALL